MQCPNCKKNDFDKSWYDYYICRNCGSFYYDNNKAEKKPGVLNDYYFMAGVGIVVFIILILVLLYITALSRKEKIASEVKTQTVEIKK